MDPNIQKSKTSESQWWDNFLIESEQLTKTGVYKNAFTREDADLLSTEMLNVLKQLCRLRTNKYGYRLYIDGNIVGEKELNHLFDHPPLVHENVENYARRVFTNQEFGMIINGCEKFSDPLSKKLLELLAPLISKIGIPLTGLSVHTFIGNYGYTPLGIHKDLRGENVFHFHLGPGSKVMYNWTDEVYDKIDGKTKNKDKKYDELIPFAEKHPFEATDIYFMPWNKLHLGKTDGLSIGVTVWFNNPTKLRFFETLFSSLSKQYMIPGDTPQDIYTPIKDPHSQESFTSLKALFEDEENLFDLPFSNLLEILHNDYKLALFSNGGWKTRILSLSDEKLYDINNYAFLRDKTLKLTSPFTIFYRKSLDDKKIILFARGSKLKFNYHQNIETLLDLINTQEPLNTNELLSTLPSDWPESAGLYILGLLYDKRTIEIT